ncbi:2-enoyl thioester reductase domain-containing protein [Ruficoccus sp. ZRK36]|uniref:MDR family NADPH-dependent oxidoreductase n=1 Tax=Ruficoccus sp. ZRK36 TaxID=2866311 RepID=UPI001C73A257|nr:2-enoyl thioester reductase domain-containing protein [Ruficoccus sp. ZRK36]QYY37209.1 2-enoyl thioester reductase domain-containing protein [Ruficoccus sp. ZRK36]
MNTEPQAVRYHERGKPEDVLKLESMPAGNPGKGEALVALRAAVIHPSDMGMIGGTYGRLPDLPAVGGREGAGVVLAVGEGVTELKVGQQVKMPEALGAWRQAVVAPVEDFIAIPNEVPAEMAAQAFINPPTALRILRDFIDFKPGEWIIQNAANSAVGVSMIQLAHHCGLKTINVVRDAETWEPILKDMGADVVVAEESGYEKKIKELTGGAKPRLGLNSIGGDSVIRLIRCMADSAKVVTFGGMVGDKVRFPTRNLIFNDLHLCGFWMDKWVRTHSKEEFDAMQAEIFDLMAKGALKLPIDSTYSFDKATEAVARANAGGRKGKVLITSDWQG